ncbi:MAG: VanZ family protein [Ignavibacteria bacterium]|jgi:VanZ family protein|nr:VanZ family protein [Ignavibacteria bacterium]HOU98818.1 VanZ family protein [Bacteroidales bacterium]
MIWNLVFSIIWTIIIIIGSAISGNTLDHVSILKIPHIDKIIHFIWYYVLYISWYSYFLKKNVRFIKIRYRLFLIITIICFGWVIELFQQYVFIKRSAELNDFIADSMGVIMAFTTYFYAYQSKLFGRFL